MSIIMDTCPWPLAGLLVGAIAVGLQWVDNLPLGATGAAAGFLSWVRRPWARPSWRAFFFVGTVLGGFVYARLTGRFALSWSTAGLAAVGGGVGASTPLLLAGAGGLIGFGARWAGGCTSGHGICGVGRLEKGSLLATVTFVATAVVTAQLVGRVTGR
jgi:uncharacterized membrane protein YedE/YeeE